MRILVTGATGQLGPYIVRRLLQDGHATIAWSHRAAEPVFRIAPRPLSLVDKDAVAQAFKEADPQVVVHCAAISNINEAFNDARRAEAVNVDATRLLAELCGRRGARMIYLSTDLVFDGEQGHYTETDAPHPLSVYARTKLAGEAFVLNGSIAASLVMRLPLVFGPSLAGQEKFFDHLLTSLRQRKPVTLFDDEWRTPVSPRLVAEAVATAVREEVTGLFHLAGPDRLSRHDMGVRLAEIIGGDPALLRPASRLSIESPEPRPRDTSLDASKWYERFPRFPRPSFDEGVRELLR